MGIASVGVLPLPHWSNLFQHEDKLKAAAEETGIENSALWITG